MIVLKAIGAFFVKVWRWIKETAWVQPLLIVGAIFAVIFSIPYITDWVNSWGYGAAGTFFNSQKQSLEGQVASGEDGDETKADIIIDDIWENTQKAYEGQTLSDEEVSKYGRKFYLIFTADDCSGCTSAEEGFDALDENWGDILVPEDYDSYKSMPFYTINTSETSSNDDDYEEPAGYNDKAFYRFLDKHMDFFNETGSKLEEAPYKNNASVSDTSYDNYSAPKFADFTAPTILLIDYTDAAITAGRGGVSEVLFGVSGTTDLDRAKQLLQMWDHMTTRTNNPFGANYIA